MKARYNEELILFFKRLIFIKNKRGDKMNKLKCMLTVPLITISVLPLAGCQSLEEKDAIKLAKAHVEHKYGEEFAVGKIDFHKGVAVDYFFIEDKNEGYSVFIIPDTKYTADNKQAAEVKESVLSNILSLDNTPLEYRTHSLQIYGESSARPEYYFKSDYYDGDIVDFLGNSNFYLDVHYKADKELKTEEEIKSYLDELSQDVIKNKEMFVISKDSFDTSAQVVLRLYKPDKCDDYNEDTFEGFDAETMYGQVVISPSSDEWRASYRYE